jgi:hypothetical protein
MGISPAGFAMSELSKVIQRCNPDFDSARAISWQVGLPVADSWQQWMKALFEPLLLPHLLRVLEFSARQSAREIILLDAHGTVATKAQCRGWSIAAPTEHSTR